MSGSQKQEELIPLILQQVSFNGERPFVIIGRFSLSGLAESLQCSQVSPVSRLPSSVTIRQCQQRVKRSLALPQCPAWSDSSWRPSTLPDLGSLTNETERERVGQKPSGAIEKWG